MPVTTEAQINTATMGAPMNAQGLEGEVAGAMRIGERPVTRERSGLVLIRSLFTLALLVPVVSAQLSELGEDRAEMRQHVAASSGLAPVAAPRNLAGSVVAQQRSWSQLLASMNIGAASEPAPIVTSAPIAISEPTVPAPMLMPVADDRPQGGTLSVSLPVATVGSPLVISRTPRREVLPSPSGTLRLSTAPTALKPLAAGTVRRLMDSTQRLSLQSMVAASTRMTRPNTASFTSPSRTAATPAQTRTHLEAAPALTVVANLGFLREDGLASSLKGDEFLCSEPQEWAPIGTPSPSPTCDELRDTLFRPEGTPRQWVLVEELGFEPARDPYFDRPAAIHWAWNAETMLQFESMTDENNPFDGEGGRTFLVKIFPGL